MRVLALGINFGSELVGIGKYTGELAAYLNGDGHEVRVVTTPPYYPYWRVQPPYRWWQYRHENKEGMDVYRCPLWVPRKPSSIKRLTHLLSFAISSFPVLLWQMQWHPDTVLCVAPAFFCAPFAWITARLCGAKAWLHIQDFELDAATNLGMLPSGNLLTRIASAGERWLLRRFDRVSTISARMVAQLVEKGVRPERAYLFPNWVDTRSIFTWSADRQAFRESLGIPDDQVVILYSGTMGHKQGLECLVEAARRLTSHRDIRFVLCGEGAARQALESACAGMPNVMLLPLQPPERLNGLLNAADIHILPQRADAADLVMPSKLLGMMASGKAIVATARADTEVGEVVNQVGLVVPPGDIDALCETIVRLAGSLVDRARLGEKARAYVCGNWDADLVLPRFEAQLLSLVNKEHQLLAASEQTVP